MRTGDVVGPGRRKASLAIAAVGLLLLVCTAFFFPVFRGETFLDVRMRQGTLYPWSVGAPVPPFIHYDQTDSFYPWQVFFNRTLRALELPLWSPYSFAGHPFFANSQSGILYPPRTLLSFLVPPERVHDILLFSHMLIGGITMYALLKSAHIGFSAAVFGAVAWMLNSFMLSWMGLEHFIVIEAWLPLALLLMYTAIVRQSILASLGLSVTMALIFIGGNLLYVMITFVAIAAYAGFLIVRRMVISFRRAGWRATCARVMVDGLLAALAFFGMLGLVAFQLLPSVELIRTMGRSTVPFDTFLTYRVQLGELQSFFVGLFPRDPEEPVSWYHHQLFVGTPTALLAILGIFRRHPLAAYSRGLALVVLLIVLGTPLTWLAYTLLPGFNTFKPLARAFFLFDIAAVIMAAFGLDLLLRGPSPIAARRAWGVVLSVAVTAVVLVQMFQFSQEVVHHQPASPEYLYPETPITRTVGRDDETRILNIHPFLFGSIFMVFEFQNGGGYESLLPLRTTRLWRVVEGATPEEAFDELRLGAFQATFHADTTRFDLLPRLAVTDLLAPPVRYYDQGHAANERGDRRLEQAPTLELAYDAPDGRRYEVLDALPRAFLVGGCERVESDRKALERFVDPAFDPRQAVLVEVDPTTVGGPPCVAGATVPAGAAAGTATVTRDSINSLRVHVEAAQPSWLVVNETWDTGWVATVDGAPSPILLGNYTFRAIPLTAGVHEVAMRYVPLSFRVGVAVTVTTALLMLGAAALLLLRRARRKRERVASCQASPASSV